jgi:predicted dienelactone hydrolase
MTITRRCLDGWLNKKISLAVIPMAPDGAWLFGERGLAAVDHPTLIIAASAGDINIYNLEAAYVFKHLCIPYRAIISFIGEGHMMVYNDEPILRMKHFATAFFGFHLQGCDTYARYFLDDFVSQRDDLAWGLFEGK